jgi:hypothetical protein
MEARGGVITQVLQSIGAAAETGVDKAGDVTSEALKSANKTVETITNGVSKGVTDVTKTADTLAAGISKGITDITGSVAKSINDITTALTRNSTK